MPEGRGPGGEIAKKVEEKLTKEYEEAQRQGKYPWEGMWLKREQIEGLIKVLKTRDKIVFLEVTLVLASLLFSSLIFCLLLVKFLLPQ